MPFPILEGAPTTANSGSTAQASITVAKPSGTAVDDLLILFVYNDPGTSSTPPFQTPSGFTPIYNVEGASFADLSLGVFWRIADGTEGADFTITANDSARIGAVCFRISGADTTTPIDVLGTETNQGTGTTHDHTSFNTGSDEVLVLAVGTYDGGDDTFSITAGTAAGWSALTQLNNGNASTDVSAWYATKQIATSGTLSPIMTVQSGLNDGSIQVQFSIANDGSPPPEPPPDPDPDPGETAEPTSSLQSSGVEDPHLVVFEPDHAAQAECNLLAHQRCKVRIPAYARALGSAAQLLEDVLFGILVGGTVLESMTLDALRRWGAIVGESQGALTKAQYQRVILLRKTVNAFGRTDTPIAIKTFAALVADLFSPSTTTLTLHTENGTTLWRVVVDSGAALLPEALAQRASRLLALARPTGALVVVQEHEAGTYRLDVGPGLDQGTFGRDLYDGRWIRG